ncbi:c-type cytochrome [Notoacmeibacter ruber]|uniref:Cytochrome c n=1 Tax=Notoacmeibacter ruber TaxID=2670375 RepID=A0A3L7J8K1_9HYPH|nr:cytochrome c [Notoacmeibacter ruber]RLQ86946.1 cytochrome c [Notoacmeibacter ruber]
MSRKFVMVLAALFVVLVGGWFVFFGQAPSDGGEEQASLVIPTLSGEQLKGKALFDRNCASCHGESGVGTDQGPPFIHPIYEPGHHGDQAFLLAAQNGVRAHHWRFGNMPPVAGVGQSEVRKIVAYVRAVQRANGIR